LATAETAEIDVQSVIDLVLEPVDFETLEEQFGRIHIWEWRQGATFCGMTADNPSHHCRSRIGFFSATPTHCPTCGRVVCERCVEIRRQQRGR
jgi:hypothetical protein